MLLLILSWIIFGALAGWITALTLRSGQDDKISLHVTVGIIGALIGGFVLKSFSLGTGTDGFNIASLITAVIGSVMMIAAVRGFNRA